MALLVRDRPQEAARPGPPSGFSGDPVVPNPAACSGVILGRPADAEGLERPLTWASEKEVHACPWDGALRPVDSQR